jgi:hypothetical protein
VTPSRSLHVRRRAARTAAAAVAALAMAGAGLFVSAPAAWADPVISVTTDKTAVAQGDSASITIAGPGTAVCALWLGSSLESADLVSLWAVSFTLSQANLATWYGADPNAENTVDIRCYDIGSSLTPSLGDTFVSVVNIVYAGAAATPSASPTASPAGLGVTTDRVIVYEGGSATIRLSGPADRECDEWIGQTYFQSIANFVGSLEDWNGGPAWSWADLTYWIQNDTADTTLYFRCYDWAYGTHGGQEMATLDTPYAAGVTIVFKAAGVTPPPTATAGGIASGGTALPLFLAGLIGALSVASLRRMAATRR